MLKEKRVLMGTLATRITDPAKLKNPNVVKLTLDKDGFALYFSRYPIPYVRDVGASRRNLASAKTYLRRLSFYEHIGMYGFRKDFLVKFSALQQTPLEKTEGLEQLRALENGYRIKVYLTQYKPVTLDAPSDLKKMRGQKGGVVG
jgi:3-deoxy-manno-octulosonate cytidylyltransferase (CMP-KDO synthetase)